MIPTALCHEQELRRWFCVLADHTMDLPGVRLHKVQVDVKDHTWRTKDGLIWCITLKLRGDHREGWVAAAAIPVESRARGPNTLDPGPYLGSCGVLMTPVLRYYSPVTPEALKGAVMTVLEGFDTWGPRESGKL